MHEDGWFRWWTHAELVAHPEPERFEPATLAQLLPPIIEGRFPQQPIELTA